MACSKCKKSLSKADDSKRIEERIQPDGSIEYFGIATGLKKLSEAKGKIKGVYHYRCYFVMKKHDRMGPNGRYLDDSPTAYEMSQRHENKDDTTEFAHQRREKAEEQYAALREKVSELTQRAEHEYLGDAVLDLEKELAEAEQAVALAKRQEEIAAEREKEETPSAWADWRDPVTKDI